MELPPGYEPLTYLCKDYVMHLHKAVYGLKQAPRAWNITYSDSLRSLGYLPSPIEPCSFRREEYSHSHEGEKITGYTYVCLYVDDLLICASDEVLDNAKSEIMVLFSSRDLGEVKHYMGMKFDYNCWTQTLKISMPDYCRNLAQRCGLENAAPKRDPISATHGMKPGPKVFDSVSLGWYATAIGALLWPALTCHPEIAYTVSYLASANHCFTPQHLSTIKHLICYLKATPDQGITYDGCCNFIEYTFADANWGPESDGQRKSQSGYVTMLAGGAVSWGSKRQKSVALSTKVL
ncbi:Copia-like polyprotein/retrotransposon, putative, partial [Rhizoctonia solani AG-3 Rhs1AP]